MLRSISCGLWAGLMRSVLLVTVALGPNTGSAQTSFVATLPQPGEMIETSAAYTPVMIKGLRLYSGNPLLFDFIMDSGQSGLSLSDHLFAEESRKLIKYFLASLTVNDDDQWVNLSPYESGRIIPADLSVTDLGRDMLAQDYILKQLMASLFNPEKGPGRKFWARIYSEAQARFGTSDIPLDTFNKVWIVADRADVLERNNVAFVVGAHLKVMLQEDYAVLQPAAGSRPKPGDSAHALALEVVREVVIPEIEKEVNCGRHFAPLRQMYYAMILAAWYKSALKSSLLNQVYSNKGKMAGIVSDDPLVGHKIYKQYVKAYTKGVFNYIRENIETDGDQLTAIRLFSGGIPRLMMIDQVLRIRPAVRPGDDFAMLNGVVIRVGMEALSGQAEAYKVSGSGSDEAMLTVTPQDALQYQTETRARFIERDHEAALKFGAQKTFESGNQSVPEPKKYFESLFQNIPIRNKAGIWDIYRQVQLMVEDTLGWKVSVLDVRPEEIHITISNDDVAPKEELTLTLDQLIDDVQEDLVGVLQFDMELVGPHLMPNKVVVMEYTTNAPAFLYLRRKAQQRRATRHLSEGNRGFVPDIMHSTVCEILDPNVSQSQLDLLRQRLNAFRAALSHIVYRVEEIGVSHFYVEDRRFITTRTISLDSAMEADPGTMTDDALWNQGGIVFNAGKMKVNVFQGIGNVDKYDLDPAVIAGFERGDFSGIRFRVESIVPITDMLLLMGLGIADSVGSKGI